MQLVNLPKSKLNHERKLQSGEIRIKMEIWIKIEIWMKDEILVKSKIKSESQLKSASKVKPDLNLNEEWNPWNLSRNEIWITTCSKINPDPTQEIEGYVTREVFYIIKLRLVQV